LIPATYLRYFKRTVMSIALTRTNGEKITACFACELAYGVGVSSFSISSVDCQPSSRLDFLASCAPPT